MSNTTVTNAIAGRDPKEGEISYDWPSNLDLQDPQPGVYPIIPILNSRNYRLVAEESRAATLTVSETLPKDSTDEFGGDVPSVALAPDGSIHVAYLNNGKLQYLKTDREGRELAKVNDILPVFSPPKIAVDSEGNAHLVVVSNQGDAVFYVSLKGLPAAGLVRRG